MEVGRHVGRHLLHGGFQREARFATLTVPASAQREVDAAVPLTALKPLLTPTRYVPSVERHLTEEPLRTPSAQVL